MARLDAEPGAVTRADVLKVRRRVLLKGYRGMAYVAKWPRARGKKKTVLQQAWVDYFSHAARQAKTPSPDELSVAQDLAHGTLWYWRDVMQTAFAGKLFRWNSEEPVRTPTANIFRNLAQALPASGATILTPDEATWDNNAFWSDTVNPTRLTVRGAGLYLVGAFVEFLPNSDNDRLIRVRYDGVTYGAGVAAKTGVVFPGWLSIMEPHYFHSGEYVELEAIIVNPGQTAKINSFWVLAITPEALIS